MTGTTNKRWQVTIENAGNDEVLIPLPDELLERLGWKIGDEVEVDTIKARRADHFQSPHCHRTGETP